MGAQVLGSLPAEEFPRVSEEPRIHLAVPRGEGDWGRFFRSRSLEFDLHVPERYRLLMGEEASVERRSPGYPRVSVDVPVELSYAGRTWRVHATTLGGGGMMLSVTDPPPVGAEIDLRFRPAKHLPVIRAKAKVLYQIPQKGTGVQFTEISPEDRQILLRLIHHRLADQRKYPRAPLVAQVEFEESMSLSFSRDVSLGGMFVETPQMAPVGSRVRLRFHLENGGPVIVAEAEVAYHVGKLGMGVRFNKISSDDRNRIGAYIAKWAAAADPTEASSSA